MVVDDGGSMIKMVCPAPAVVVRHSVELGTALERIAAKKANDLKSTRAQKLQAYLDSLGPMLYGKMYSVI